jgi:hypothetical protein
MEPNALDEPIRGADERNARPTRHAPREAQCATQATVACTCDHYSMVCHGLCLLTLQTDEAADA